MIRNKLIIIITTLAVVLVVFYLVGQFRESPQPKAAMLHDVSANFTIYLTYNSTDYAEGSSIDIPNSPGFPGTELTVKVWDNDAQRWVTGDWDVFPYGYTNVGTGVHIYSTIDSQANKKIYYNLDGNGNTNVWEQVGGINASAQVIIGSFNLI